MRVRQLLALVLLVMALLLLPASAALAHQTGRSVPGADATAKAAAPIGSLVVAAPVALTQSSHQQLVLSTTTKRATRVYITDTGIKYHRKGCQYLRYSKHRVTLKWAKRNGYTPCKVCKPPR